MTAIAAIINDLKSLSEAAMAAAHDGDWDAFERYEGVRLSLVAALSGIAADPVLRPQVVEALKNAQRLGLEIGMAVDRARHAGRSRQQAGQLGPRRDRKSVVEGKGVSVRVDRGGRRVIIKKHCRKIRRKEDQKAKHVYKYNQIKKK